MNNLIESKIIKCLQDKAIKVINDKNIKCLNINYDPPVDKKWWEVVYIPNNIENEFWADTAKTYRGIFRLILHWPQKSQGIYKPLEEAERVANGFQKNTELFSSDDTVKVIITDTPNITTIIEDRPQLMIGLTIKYSCFNM